MKNTLVIGASTNRSRYSNLAIHKLLKSGHVVFAIGLHKGNVEGVEIQTGIPWFENLDTVTLYIAPEHQPEYYDYIISLRPKRVIFNPGTENPEFYELLKQNHIEVDVSCTLVLLATNQY